MSTLFGTLLAVSLSVGVIIGIIMFLSPLMDKRFTAKWKYWLWLVLAVRLLLPIQVALPQTDTPTEATQVSAVQIAVPRAAAEPLADILVGAADNPSTTTGVSEPSAQVNAGADANQATPAPANPWYYQLSLLDIAGLIWALGAAVFLLWHLCHYWYCKKELARWRRPYQHPLLAQIDQELGIKKIPELYISAKAPGPMMLGFFRPVVYLPEIPDDAGHLYFILKHELIHWRRKDIWYKLLLLVACAVHWFNPLVHLAFRFACRDLEMACDEAVIANSSPAARRQYSEAIFAYMQKQVCRPAQISTYFNGGIKTMKQRFSNILSTAVKRRGRVALVAVILVLVAAGSLFACSMPDAPTIPDDNNSANWPQNIIAELGAMDEQELRDYLVQPVTDGTIEEIAQQLVSHDIAAYFLNKITGEGTGNGDYDAVIIDAEITSIDLRGSYNEDSIQPLYVYSPQYRLLPDDPDKVVLAGARDIDDEGWIINSNMMNSRILVTPAEDGSYSFLGCPAFDLPLELAVQELLYGANSAAVMDFTMSGDNFTYTLGRQVGEYPWNDGYAEGIDITDAGTIDNTDMPGTEFSRAVISTGHDDLGQTEMVWYRVEETGMEYIYSLATTDPYVNCGFAGYHHARVGQTEAELLEGWGDVLTESANIVDSGEGTSLCAFDKVYTYTLEFSDDSGKWTWLMDYYLNNGLIAGVEMFMVLY